MIRYFLSIMLLGLLVVGLFNEVRVAAQGTSTNFRIDESFIGPGGNLDSSSSNYQFETGQQAVGGSGATQGESTTYSSQGGSKTASEPRLACVVNTGSVNFGALSTSVPVTATATFSVLNYTSYGYIVSIVGTPPRTGSYILDDMNTNGASQAGTEQFGINLVANTSPTTFGADPVQVPDSSFSSGAVAANYDTPNSFRYNNGETIAEAGESSGQTDYTISYLVNVSATTAGGTYSGSQVLVCTGTY